MPTNKSEQFEQPSLLVDENHPDVLTASILSVQVGP